LEGWRKEFVESPRGLMEEGFRKVQESVGVKKAGAGEMGEERKDGNGKPGWFEEDRKTMHGQSGICAVLVCFETA
jgi:hypothetical protein